MDYFNYYFDYLFGTTFMFIGIAVAILYVVAYWKIFTKAGLEGWKSLIPFYNQYCLYKIAFGRDQGWMFLLELIPCVGVIVSIIKNAKLSTNFGHGTAFALGLIFLGNIFYLILGYGKSRYVGEPLY